LSNPLILSLESTCDETAAAVIDGDRRVLSSVVASQHELHSRYQGVVPEIAARAHLERILPVIDEAIKTAGITLADLDAIAVATQPGLSGSLLIGLSAAKGICLALGKKLIAVNHLHAHIYACQMSAAENIFPCLGLIVSGGHTSLYKCLSPHEFQLLGGTIDDAAGEAFDKVANMLDLPFPGGPNVSKLAEQGNPKGFSLPRSFANDQSIRFSFSGLKTAVRYTLIPPGETDFSKAKLSQQERADLAASFEQAVIDVLVEKSILAAKLHDLPTLCVGGGVAANKKLRQQLASAASEANLSLIIAPLELCTDNAAMGAIAIEQYHRCEFADLDLEITPGLVRAKAKK
jgi:N6-L-threonylcarbamoyladenine synthase